MYSRAKSTNIAKFLFNVGHRSASQFTKNKILRREQAARSLLIKFPGDSVPGKLKNVLRNCEKYGKVLNMFLWPIEEKVPKVMTSSVLVEFENRRVIDDIYRSSSFFPDQTGFSVRTRQLFNSPSPSTGGKLSDCKQIVVENQRSLERLHLQLIGASSLSDQMELLHQHDQMTETALRMRYFICSDIEEALNYMLSSCYVLPFGSTVNGFGTSTGDLDMVLLHAHEKSRSIDPGNFYYMSKRSTDDKMQATRTLTLISNIIKLLLPNYVQVDNILRARVPIVKFTNQVMEVQCDLSVEHRESLPMSELLYNLTVSEPKFPQLLFTLKKWAYTHGVITQGSTNKLSTFMLIMLTINFLQMQQPPVLPPLNTMVAVATHSKQPVIRPGRFRTQSRQDSGALLLMFFKYYADFNFHKHGIDVLQGKLVDKSSMDEPSRLMYLQNPIVPTHNVCQNVATKEVNNFQVSCMDSYLALSKDQQGSGGRSSEKTTEHWGMLKILDLLSDHTSTIKSKEEENTAVNIKESHGEQTNHSSEPVTLTSTL